MNDRSCQKPNRHMLQRSIKSETHKRKLVYWKLNSSKSIPELGVYDLDII